MGAIDEVRNLENVLYTGLQALQESIAQLRLPSPTSVSPLSLSTAGGDTVTITGNQFDEATAVSFGSLHGVFAATSFTVVSDTEITAVNPGNSAGPGSTIVNNSYGEGVHGWSVAPFVWGTWPLITELSPNNGIVGDTITITGVCFTGATAVNFPSAAATSYTVVSDTEITAVVPSGAGSGDVTVTTSAGTSLASGQSEDQFTQNT